MMNTQMHLTSSYIPYTIEHKRCKRMSKNYQIEARVVSEITET